MTSASQQIYGALARLAWSCWTEAGVAGLKREHARCLILPEELLLLAVFLAEFDPRLRDEVLDWCLRNHRLISVSRLRVLFKGVESWVGRAFCAFAATLNGLTRANWPVLGAAVPFRFTASGKSLLPRLEAPALLCLRLRELFGVGARADLICACLCTREVQADFTAADRAEIGYSKRAVAAALDALVASGVFEDFLCRNQRRYRFKKRQQMEAVVGSVPQIAPPWRLFLEVVLPVQACIVEVEDKPVEVRVVQLRIVLQGLEAKLQRLGWLAPPLQADLQAYWESAVAWVLQVVGGFGV